MLRVSGLAKSYGPEPVLRGVDLTLERAETLAILGRSGSGKTTLLKIIAGLVTPDAGSVTPADTTRGVYLYQEPLLFPHLDVSENLAFGMKLRKHDRAAVKREVDAMLDALGLTPHARKRVHELSGGQRQRVAFGRALLVRPKLLLLDEPFAALDAETRSAMRTFFKSLVARYSVATIFVTHDIKEALEVGDRFALLRDGGLTTYGTRSAFLEDPTAGVRQEIHYWTTLASSY